jgi:hypothetical protein
MQQSPITYQYPPRYPATYNQMQPMQSMQSMQPQYGSPSPEQLLIEQQMREQKQYEMKQHYNNIYATLAQILSSKEGALHVDPYNLLPVGSDPKNPIPKEKMADLFKHLLNYTYLSTASEIKNHEEINMQLADIKATLLKLIKPDAPAPG